MGAALALGAGIGAVMWIPPVVQQFTTEPGNLSELWRYYTSTGEPTLGWSAAYGQWTSLYELTPSWLPIGESPATWADTTVHLPVLALVVVAGVATAVLRRNVRLIRGLGIAIVANLAAVVATASVRGAPNAYLVVPTRGVAAVTLALAVAAIVDAVPTGAATVVRTVALSLAGVLAAVVGIRQVTATEPAAPYAPTIEALSDAIEDQSDSCSLRVDSNDDFQANEVLGAVMLQLERRGVDAGPADRADRFGSHRTSDTDDRCEVLIAPPSARADVEQNGYRVFSEYQPLTAEVQRRLATLREREAAVARQLPQTSDPDAQAKLFLESLTLQHEVDELVDGRVPMLAAIRRPADT